MDVRQGDSLLHYRLAERAVEVRCEGADVRRAVTAVLEYFGLRRRPPTDVRPAARLTFSAHAPPPEPSTDVRLVTRHNGVDVRRGADGWLLQERENVVRLDPGAGTATGALHSPPWATRSTLHLPFVNLVIHSLLLLLRPKGYWPLHAAALAKEGAGLLIVGASDSGKSTQALGLVRAGWHYLSDDSVLLRKAGEEIEAVPLRRDFGLDDAAEGTFPEIAPHARPFLTDERKRRVDMAALHPGQAADRCTPRLLLFPSIADRPQSELVPIGQKDALFRLMRQSVLLALGPDIAAPHLEALGRLSGQAEGYRLLAGHDLRDRPERLADFLAPLLPGATSTPQRASA